MATAPTTLPLQLVSKWLPVGAILFSVVTGGTMFYSQVKQDMAYQQLAIEGQAKSITNLRSDINAMATIGQKITNLTSRVRDLQIADTVITEEVKRHAITAQDLEHTKRSVAGLQTETAGNRTTTRREIAEQNLRHLARLGKLEQAVSALQAVRTRN